MKIVFGLSKFSSRYLFHIFVWVVYGLYGLMTIQPYLQKKGWLFAISPFILSLVYVGILIYLNAFLLVPKLLDKKKIIFYLVSVLFIILTISYLKSISRKYWDSLVWPEEPMPLFSYFNWNLLDSVWSILISTLLLFSLRWNDQRQKIKNIEVMQLQTELKYLRSQMNPHFLFNGLNTIYGNIDRHNQEARNILLQFSDLLRYNLYEADVDWVELSKEANYLENYVALQKARSNSNLTISLEIDITNRGIKVVPLIFIAFVENAFKFTSRDDNTDNFVKVSLKQSGSTIHFRCENSCEVNDTEKSGIGLANVRRRLELLYKDRYLLNIGKEHRTYIADLQISI